MRIISGSARGTKLLTLEGENTRPTSERAKEAVFSILQFELRERRVLDLFAGSGQLALEALSRGASSVRMVDAAKQSCAMARKNLEKSKLTGGSVVQSDCLQFVKRDAGKYDIIFADPPYAKAVGDRDMIAELMTDRLHELLTDDGYFIAEAQVGYGVGDIHTREFPGWDLIDERTYGKNTILFYRKQQS
jgi:16S rRNA (guanine966-N2)-methyltransferase